MAHLLLICYDFVGNCAKIIAANIIAQPIISLADKVWCNNNHPASTLITDSKLKINDATVGFIPF